MGTLIREVTSEVGWYLAGFADGEGSFHVVPFFERFGFRSIKKKRDFKKFKQIASIVAEKRHLWEEGVRKILDIRREMNDGGKRKYQDEQILERYRSGNPQRLYARRSARTVAEKTRRIAE